MRETLLLTLALAACGEAPRPPLVTPEPAEEPAPRVHEPTRLEHGADRARTAAFEALPTASIVLAADVEPIAVPGPRVHRAPRGLLEEPGATEEQLADWYRGSSDRVLFATHYRLGAFLAQRDEDHPLKPEHVWLGEELTRRIADPARVVTSGSRQGGFEALYAQADLEEISWRLWVLNADLSAFRQKSGRPLILM